MINWKVLLGLLLALTIVLFSSLLINLKSNRDKAQVIINDLNKSAQAATGTNEKLSFLLDSITTEFAHLNERVALLETQKDSLSKGISRPKTGLISKSVTGNMAQDYYMNCENIVQIEIPPKYARSKLKYSSKGADILETPDRGRIIMVPLQRIVHIVIESEGTIISTIELPPIKNVPVPAYHVYQGGQKIDLNRGRIARTLSSLTVVAEPEPNFKAAVPKDARYHIKRWVLNVTRGRSSILRREFKSESLDQSIDLRADQSLFRAGDIVHIDVVDVVRFDFRNYEQKVTVPNAEGLLTFPIL